MPKAKTPKPDAILLDAVDEARSAAADAIKSSSIGEHVGGRMIADRLALHTFESLDAGYPGWLWEVTVSRAPRAKTVTVCEVGLAPGPDALLAPAWIPWVNRLRPGDAAREDVLPYNGNDPRLMSGFEQTDEAVADVLGIDEIGFGRARVLSSSGIDQAAERWYASDRGPSPRIKPGATCSTCGFLIKMQGSLGQVFGICANEWAQDDGSVVALSHGCGAHSETDTKKRVSQWPIAPSRVDDFDLETWNLDEI